MTKPGIEVVVSGVCWQFRPRPGLRCHPFLLPLRMALLKAGMEEVQKGWGHGEFQPNSLPAEDTGVVLWLRQKNDAEGNLHLIPRWVVRWLKAVHAGRAPRGPLRFTLRVF